MLKRYARPAALVILALVTVYGVRQFLAGDWETVRQYWSTRLWLIPLVLLISTLDVFLEGVGWMWVYKRFRIPVIDWQGAGAYLAGRSCLLLPAQLGRLVRPDAVARLGKGEMSVCLKAEAVAFVLDAASVLALLGALLAFKIHPLLSPVPVALVAVVVMALGNWIGQRLTETALSLPKTLWWSWKTPAIIVIQMGGWAAYGLALWVMVWGLPGSLSLWDVLFYSAGSSVVGVGSGLPGGIGATELLLGVSLSIGEIPADHLVVVVGAFRVLTLWIWIPIGWIALLWVQRRAALLDHPVAAEPAPAPTSDNL